MHQRIYLILKANYLDDFYQKVAQIPTKIFRKHSCLHGLRFNSIGDDIGGHEEREREAARQKPKGEPVITEVLNRGTFNQNQWIYRRQAAVTSTHKPVNIITQILNKHVRKDKQELNRMIGQRKYASKGGDSSMGLPQSMKSSRRAVYAAADNNALEMPTDSSKGNFQSMINVERDDTIKQGSYFASSTLKTESQSMSNLDMGDNVERQMTQLPNQLPNQTHGPNSIKITGMSS